MQIFIHAYGKNLAPHQVFKGELKKENIRDWPSPSTFNGKVHCSPIVLGNEAVKSSQYIFLNEEGVFEPGVQINVAAELILHGRYRVYQQFGKDELILMLASIMKKSDVPDVIGKLEILVEG